MSDSVTTKQLNDALAKQTNDISEIMQSFMQQVSEQLVNVNSRLDELDKKYDHLINTIDGFIARIDKYETELAARDAKIDRLERWIEQIAKKTGTPMPL